MRTIKAVVSVFALAFVALGVFIWSGLYNVGADVPHWRLTTSVLAIARNRSIAMHASDIKVPNLDDPQMIAMGAGHYSEMCTGCHLAPGMDGSELREGLYPKPPVLYKTGIKDPARAFWIIKHGIKLTAMPAWGASHDDHAIWAIVAFIRKLPQLSPAQYKAMTVNAHDSDDQDSSHSHGDTSVNQGQVAITD